MKNVAVQSPTGDMLVNQLRTGSLDAVVVYISNATYAGDEVEAIGITGHSLLRGRAADCRGQGVAAQAAHGAAAGADQVGRIEGAVRVLRLYVAGG